MKNEPETQFSPLENCLIVLNHTINNLISAVQFQDDGIKELKQKILDFANDNPAEKINPQGLSQEEIAKKFLTLMNADPEIKKIKRLSMILYEYSIINLRKLLEIHPTLVKHLRELEEEELEISLQDFWQPIQKLEKRIIDWRNKFIVHANYNAKKHLKYTDIDENYEFLPKEIFFASICAILYCSGIAQNLIEFSSAIDTHQRQIQYEKNAFKVVEWENVHKELGQIIKKAKKTLKKNGYNSKIEFIAGRKYPKLFESE